MKGSRVDRRSKSSGLFFYAFEKKKCQDLLLYRGLQSPYKGLKTSIKPFQRTMEQGSESDADTDFMLRQPMPILMPMPGGLVSFHIVLKQP